MSPEELQAEATHSEVRRPSIRFVVERFRVLAGISKLEFEESGDAEVLRRRISPWYLLPDDQDFFLLLSELFIESALYQD